MLLAAAMLIMTASGAAADSALLRLKDKIEACVSTNAAGVEKSEPSLSEAVSFLLNDLCIEQVSAFERYRTNAAYLDEMKSKYAASSYDAAVSPLPSDGMGPGFQKSARKLFTRQKARFETAKIDPDTGRLIYTVAAEDGDDPVTPCPSVRTFSQTAPGIRLQASSGLSPRAPFLTPAFHASVTEYGLVGASRAPMLSCVYEPCVPPGPYRS
jgi:hypothetical protein